MKGTWGVLLLYINEPNSIYIFKNGSPLLVGFENNFSIIASERSAFNNKVKNYISIENKKIVKLIKEKNNSIKRLVLDATNMKYLLVNNNIKKIIMK